MLRVALTGGIATGKSYVLKEFAKRDVPTIDADQLSHAIVRPNGLAWDELLKHFGPTILTVDGSLDRKYLAEKVFSDAKIRNELESIIHPHVRIEIDKWFKRINATKTADIGIADIPLLFETNRETDFDRVIVTACDPRTQLERLIARDRLSKDNGRKRLAAQLPTATKAAGANFIINTGGTFNQTDRQIHEVYLALQEEMP
jgi:dephospho-CoA kinase